MPPINAYIVEADPNIDLILLYCDGKMEPEPLHYDLLHSKHMQIM